jgi:hypothetical protein
MPVGRRYLTYYALFLDGVEIGWLKSVDGGNAEAEVIKERPNDFFAKKHPGTVKYEPITIQINQPLPKAISGWISGFMDGKVIRKNGKIVVTDYAMKSFKEIEFFNAPISEVNFPAVDASSKELVFLTIKIAPEYIRYARGSEKKVMPSIPLPQKKWLSSNFRLQIGGLDCSKVSRVESFTIRQDIKTAPDNAREVHEKYLIDFSDLQITLAASSAESWFDWHDDFVIKGNNSDDKEKQGYIAFLSQNLHDELGRVEFHNLGIFRIDQLGSSTNTINKINADLYCEKMRF